MDLVTRVRISYVTPLQPFLERCAKCKGAFVVIGEWRPDIIGKIPQGTVVNAIRHTMEAPLQIAQQTKAIK